MMFYLSKILPLFVLPIGIVLLLLVAGLWRRSWRLIVIAALVLAVSSTSAVSRRLMRAVEGAAARIPVQDVATADAIVVLSTGRVVAPGPERVSEWTDADRFFAGIALLRAGKAPRLIFTGGTVLGSAARLEGDVLTETAVSMGIASEQVLTTGAVVNTAEEAIAVAELLRRSGAGARIILVTSAFHMSRAAHLFRSVGLSPTPFPVDFSGTAGAFSPLDLLPSAGALSQTQIALREMYGRAYYRVLAR